MSHVTSAALLLYRRRSTGTEVFLVHPGGPFWRNKDDGAWSIPKGIYETGEDPLAAARREFTEETGFTAEGPFHPLGSFKMRPGKTVIAWAAEGDCAAEDLMSNTFPLEWPPKSGRFVDTPEVDRGAWFGEAQALVKIARGQKDIVAAFYARFANTRAGGAPHSIQTKAY